jgi:hypothetical protein
MSTTTGATIQLVIVVVVAAAAILLLDASATHYTLCLAVLRLANTWLRCADAALGGRRRKRDNERKQT